MFCVSSSTNICQQKKILYYQWKSISARLIVACSQAVVFSGKWSPQEVCLERRYLISTPAYNWEKMLKRCQDLHNYDAWLTNYIDNVNLYHTLTKFFKGSAFELCVNSQARGTPFDFIMFSCSTFDKLYDKVLVLWASFSNLRVKLFALMLARSDWSQSSMEPSDWLSSSVSMFNVYWAVKCCVSARVIKAL